MRFWIALFLVLFGIIALVLVVDADSGYVLIRAGGWSAETSVAVLALGILFGYLALHWSWNVLRGTQHLPGRIREYSRQNSARRARESLVKGLLELSEGRWAQAEKDLAKHANSSETPLLHYLGAARAAQLQQDPERRDTWLSKAFEAEPSAELSIGLAQAELQLLHGQLPQALATLDRLRETAPKHPYVLKLLLLVHHRLADWDALAELLPQARKQQVFSEEELRRMALEVHQRRLQLLAAAGDKTALKAAWDAVPLELWDDMAMLRAYANTLHAQGLDDTAAEVVRQGLKRDWDQELVLLFGQLVVSEAGGRLRTVEGWLKKYGDRPPLLLTAGRVCLANELWGKARSYLQESVALDPRPESWRELGMLLERLEEPEAALEAYRQAAHIQVKALGHEPAEAAQAEVETSVSQPLAQLGA